MTEQQIKDNLNRLGYFRKNKANVYYYYPSPFDKFHWKVILSKGKLTVKNSSASGYLYLLSGIYKNIYFSDKLPVPQNSYLINKRGRK